MRIISGGLPESLHKSVRNLAKRDHVSINQIIAATLAEKVSALMTEDILNKRTIRASREKFEFVLGQAFSNMPRRFRRAKCEKGLSSQLPRFKKGATRP